MIFVVTCLSQASQIIDQLPYRTPWHQGWKNKQYNVFGHIMGQYKGALNPQAHGQNSFECERTFHGGDNVIIETFAGARLLTRGFSSFVLHWCS